MSLPELLVLDWGVGGFGVVRRLRERAPGLSLRYFSDSGFTPYGKVPGRELQKRLERVLAHFADLGVCHVVVACNAASTVLEKLRLPQGLAVTEMIGPGVELARRAGFRSLGLVGGVRTVRSGVHRARLARMGVKVHGRVAQPLSARIEAGDLDSPELRAEVRRIVAPLAELPALLLACTHYPAISPLFREALPDAMLLDPAELVVEEVLRAVGVDGERQFLVEASGDPEGTRRGALLAFGVETGPVHRLTALAP